MNQPTADACSAIPIRRGHFRLESGHHSELWMTLETLCSSPSALRSSIEALASRLRQYSIDVACGPLNEGAFLALMVAQNLGCEFAYAGDSFDETRAACSPSSIASQRRSEPLSRANGSSL